MKWTTEKPKQSGWYWNTRKGSNIESVNYFEITESSATLNIPAEGGGEWAMNIYRREFDNYLYSDKPVEKPE